MCVWLSDWCSTQPPPSVGWKWVPAEVWWLCSKVKHSSLHLWMNSWIAEKIWVPYECRDKVLCGFTGQLFSFTTNIQLSWHSVNIMGSQLVPLGPVVGIMTWPLMASNCSQVLGLFQAPVSNYRCLEKSYTFLIFTSKPEIRWHWNLSVYMILLDVHCIPSVELYSQSV